MFWKQGPTNVGAEVRRQIHNLPCCSVGITLMRVLHCLPEFPSCTEAAITHGGNLLDDVNFIA